MSTNVHSQADNTAFEVGMTVRVTNLVSAYPNWCTYVRTYSRRVGATGRIIGFYRLPDVTLLSVSHDGDIGTYQTDEVERVT